MDKLVIDVNRSFTPFRPVNGDPVYTDHYSLNLILNNIPLNSIAKVAPTKMVRWNTNRPGGWQIYTELLNDNKKLNEIAASEEDKSEILMKQIDKEMRNAKFQAFGKVKEKKNIKKVNHIDLLQKEKIQIFENKKVLSDCDVRQKVTEVEKKLSSALIAQQKDDFVASLKDLRNEKVVKGKAAAVFKLKADVIGSKVHEQEPTSLIDFATNTEVSSCHEIKRVSLEYCKNLLKNRKPSSGFEEELALKQFVHEMRMKENICNDIEVLTLEMFEESYSLLKKKPGDKYKFIMNGGASVKAALFKVCQSVWKSEEMPKAWEKTTLIQLYKGKGATNDLNNMRYIHIKDEFPKFFGHLVVNSSKEIIMKNLSKYQIATKPGHRAQEHIFVLKSVIALYSKCNKSVILQAWDLSKFFDREVLVDCMNELYRKGITGKLYRLIYALNKNTRFSVQTPVGMTEEADRGEGLGQGTGEGAIISALNL